MKNKNVSKVAKELTKHGKGVLIKAIALLLLVFVLGAFVGSCVTISCSPAYADTQSGYSLTAKYTLDSYIALSSNSFSEIPVSGGRPQIYDPVFSCKLTPRIEVRNANSYNVYLDNILVAPITGYSGQHGISKQTFGYVFSPSDSDVHYTVVQIRPIVINVSSIEGGDLSGNFYLGITISSGFNPDSIRYIRLGNKADSPLSWVDNYFSSYSSSIAYMYNYVEFSDTDGLLAYIFWCPLTTAPGTHNITGGLYLSQVFKLSPQFIYDRGIANGEIDSAILDRLSPAYFVTNAWLAISSVTIGGMSLTTVLIVAFVLGIVYFLIRIFT